ncbi:MAG: hypothetical protein AAF726_21515 [Planctomycetota bacterium]
MLLPTIALLAQSGGLVPQLDLVDVHVSASAQGVEARALAVEPTAEAAFDALILEPDANGQLVRTGALEGQVLRYGTPSISATRAVGRDGSGVVRVWERAADVWRLGPDLGLSPVTGPTTPPAVIVDVDRERSVVLHRLDGLLVIHDLSTPGQPVLEASFPASLPRYVLDLAIDGDFVVLLEGDLPFFNFQLLGDLEIRVLERTPAGWIDRGTVEPPPGIDWTRSAVRSIDADDGRIAAGAQFGTPADPCGRVVVYERNGSGTYSLSDILRPPSQCSIAPGQATQFGFWVDLGGSEV